MIFPSPLRFLKSLFRAAKVYFGGYEVLVGEDEAFFRLDECLRCPFMVQDSRQCSKCTCFVDAKVLLASEECPVGTWKSVWVKKGVDIPDQYRNSSRNG